MRGAERWADVIVKCAFIHLFIHSIHSFIYSFIHHALDVAKWAHARGVHIVPVGM